MKKRIQKGCSRQSTKTILSSHWGFGTDDEQEQIGRALWPIFDTLFARRLDLLFSKENADGFGSAWLTLDIKRLRGQYDGFPIKHCIDLGGRKLYAQFDTSLRELLDDELVNREPDEDSPGQCRAAIVGALRALADEIEFFDKQQ